MTETMRQAYLTKAESWAASLWSASERHWSVRTGQDKNYRTHVIHPFISRLIGDLVPATSRNLLDLGCGDGVFVCDEQCRRMLGKDGLYMGVDINPGLLECANTSDLTGKTSFVRMNLTDPALPDTIRTPGIIWDCVLSIFVVQEIANIGVFFSNLAKVLYENTYAVIVTVHPVFAEWLRANGRLPIENGLASDNDTPWRWAGSYPIVDRYQGTFHLPHFQRTEEDYRILARTAGLTVQKVIDIPDTSGDLAGYISEGFAPFCDYPENVYWPAIGEMPSSVAIILNTEKVHA